MPRSISATRPRHRFSRWTARRRRRLCPHRAGRERTAPPPGGPRREEDARRLNQVPVRPSGGSMRHIISILIGAMLVALAAVPAVAHGTRATTEITAAAEALMRTLSPEQRKQAGIAFSDPERSGWRYVPDWDLEATGQAPRRGTRIGDFTPEQKAALHRLLQVSLSDRGYLKADG